MFHLLNSSTWPGLAAVSPTQRERLLFIGILLLVALVALTWVAIISRRRRGRHHHRHHHHHHHSSDRAPRVKGESAENAIAEASQRSHSHGRRRHRRRRREHRPRNPTLAETGGLPPIRPDDSPGPSAPPPSRP